jgi:hypothetical protein
VKYRVVKIYLGQIIPQGTFDSYSAAQSHRDHLLRSRSPGLYLLTSTKSSLLTIQDNTLAVLRLAAILVRGGAAPGSGCLSC